MTSTAATLDALIGRVGYVATPFSIELPDGEKRNVRRGEPEFHAVCAMSGRSGGAQPRRRQHRRGLLRGDIDLEGDMLKPFALAPHFDDRHPLVLAWRFLEPLLFGQVYTNKQAIASHYDADPKLFLSFLDPVFPAYSQGVYANDDEPLAEALERKFD